MVQEQKFDEAIAYYQKIIQLEPESWETYHQLGDVLSKAERWQEAVITYNQAIQLNSQFAWSYNNLGYALLKLERWSEAFPALQQAIEINPELSWAHYNLGEAYARQGQWDNALKAYQVAAKLKADLPGIQQKVGYILAQRANLNLEKAFQGYLLAIEQNPADINNYHQALTIKKNNPQLYVKLGNALVSKEQLDKAIVAYQIALQIQPKYTEASTQLAKAKNLLKQKRWEKTIAAYSRIQKFKPHLPKITPKINHAHDRQVTSSLDAEVVGEFGKILRDGQYWQEAVVFYRRAIKQYPQNGEFYSCLGEALANLRQWEEAIAAYRHALQLQPDNFSFSFHLKQVTETRKSQLARIESHFIFQQDHNSRQEVYRLIDNSGLFDRNYYSQNNPDVVRAGLDPLGHYLQKGGLEGRNPNPFFDSAYYLTQNQDLAEIGVNPLAHYLTFGAREGYNPIPLFETSYYLTTYPDVRDCGINPLKHYLQFGFKEGRNPHPLFDTAYYLQNNPDVQESGLNPLQHYLQFGFKEGRNLHPLFDTAYYLQNNPDVRESGLNPLKHYLESAPSPEKEFSPLFSISNYLEKNPEVEILGLNPLLHYLEKQDNSQRFLYWPWQCSDETTISDQRSHYNLLVFSHDASRTGGPRVLLAFLKELKKSGSLRNINLWIVIDREGEIEAEFQECGLTITLTKLAQLSGGDYEQVLRDFLTSFQEYTVNGTVLINTSAISHINDVCHQLRLPVLSWIHELPVTIDTYCGGWESFQKILASSKKIICVSDFVKSSLIKYARQEEQNKKFTTIYASPPNLEESDRFSPSEANKREIEAEFDFPKDSFIVLGCGTVIPRKGCDVFVQVANQVINKYSIPQVFFLWIGKGFDPEYIRWLQHDIQTLGLEGRVIFAGKRSNPSHYMKGADVFILTSKEDPFPLVNLEAMYYGLPAISFREGGGAPEIYDDGRRGIAVEYLNVAEMAQAIIKLKDNPQLSSAIALEAQNYIREELNWSNFVGNFRQLIKDEFDYYPQRELKITVVIPNYNHQKFIEDRIASIVNQTVKPDEIIFLDDNSTDGSAEIAVQLLGKTDIPYKIIINEQNTGSPFKQWVRGIEEASGDLIWIAESDDSCKFNLIEKLKPQFFDPDVVLAFAQSTPMGENGHIFQDNYRFYTDDICNERWNTHYKDEGVNEIARSLCLKNTIPNASAVIFKKEALTEECLVHIKNFRFVGDWLLYVSLLKEGKVAFVSDALNYHRRHSETVTSKVEKEDKHAQEVLELKRHIFSHPFVSANAISESLGRTIDDYYFLDERHNLGRVAFTKNSSFAALLSSIHADFERKYFASRSSALGILFLIGDADFGGGQIAAIRLANELAKNYRVFLCNARPGIWNDDLIGLVDSRIVLVEGTLKPTVWSNSKEQRIRVLRDLIEFHQIDILFSHIWWADRLAYEVNRELNLPWYIQMHGCYEALADHPDWDTDFLKLIEPMMNSASGVGYLTNKNLRLFKKLNLTPPKHMAQFFNGFDRTTVDFSAAESRSIQRGIDDFIFCLCSRAIPEKGWEEAISATININQLPLAQRNHKTARLILIGDSDYAKSLRSQYSDVREITFMGQQKQPTSLYGQCDVGLLPSRFKSESVPCTVIEYLACDLPVIATQIGSIPEMLSLEGDNAGLLVPISEDLKIDVTELQTMMLTYITDEQNSSLVQLV